jgi:hypothetical protein
METPGEGSWVFGKPVPKDFLESARGDYASAPKRASLELAHLLG